MPRILGRLLATAAAVLLVTCSNEGPSTTVASVTVTPPAPTVVVAGTVQLTATTKDANGSVLTGRVVTWASGTPAVATVSATGLVTGVAQGQATITATSEGQQGTAAVTVMLAPVSSVTVTPNPATVQIGQTLQLTATLKDANQNVLTGRVVTWASGNTGVATVSSTGLVTGVAQGQATITAASEGQQGTAAVTVIPVPVASVTVTPTPATVPAGQTLQLTATTKDANGNVLTGRVVTWASNNTPVATVSSTGLVTGVAQGQATITATSEGKQGMAAITVTALPVASVTVQPMAANVPLGLTVQLTATLKDANGNVVTGRVVTWASDNTAVATVNSNGLVTGVTQGQATITATSETKTGTAAMTVVSLVFAQVSAGVTHTCGVTTSGAAYCWGSNNSGQLGAPESNQCEIGYYGGVPCSTSPVAVVGGRTFATVSAGNGYHTCGVTTGGAAYCWGDNTWGQLGDGSTTGSGTPVLVSGGLSFAVVSTGNGFTCGLTTGGAAYCWGFNTVGELGNGTTTNSAVPVLVAGSLTLTAVSAGDSHACALTNGGAAYCWGANRFAQLGDGSTTNRTTPVAVAGGLSFAAVSAGLVHTCAVTAGGAAYCWGDNSSGDLGDGSTVDSRTPLAVGGGLTFQVVSAGGNYTCGLTTSGGPYCWGSNFNGQLGTGVFSGPNLLPTAVSGGLTFAAVSAGGAHTCGRTAAGTVYCWGSNTDGELGNGSTNSTAMPARVLGQQ